MPTGRLDRRTPTDLLTGGTSAKRALAAALVVFLFFLGGCGEVVQPAYDVTVLTPFNVDPFASAVKIVMSVGDRRVETAVTPGKPFTLSLTGIEPRTDERAAILLQALGPAGEIVAYGETPVVDIALAFGRRIRIFVQEPGTFGLGEALSNPRAALIALPASTLAATRAVIFGTGHFGVDSASARLSDSLGVYNPVSHTVDVSASAAPLAGIVQPRRNASAIELPDKRVLLFGGEVLPRPPLPRDPLVSTSQVDFFRLGESTATDFLSIIPGSTATNEQLGVARHSTVLAVADRAYAFGGKDGASTLDSVVAIDPEQAGSDILQLLTAAPMLAPRAAHTATSVVGPVGAEILVFGGAPTGGVIAERFQPLPTPTFIALTGAGPNRRDHAALVLPDGRVVILGGTGDDGAPRADGMIYDPRSATFAPSPITLRRARAAFAAFIVDNDLVVAGGIDAAGASLDTAEIYDVATLTLATEIPCHPRSRAAYAALPNHSVILIGGEETPIPLSAEIEIYQPRRPQ